MGVSELREKICSAIRDRRIIEFSYKWRSRVVEPYLVGVHHEEQELMVRSFQIEGESESGGIPDWRTFRLRKISGFERTEKKFDPRMEEYEPQDPVLTKRLCWLGEE